MNINDTIQQFFTNTFNLRTLFVFAAALAIAYIITKIITFFIIKIAHFVGQFGDSSTNTGRTVRMRQLETYLNVFIAIIRIIVFGSAIFIAWQYTHPYTAPLTLVGASTVFIVLAGATLAPMLRDLTMGTVMIAEKWYNVGDYITVDPYLDERGIVERMNLRSTRIRKLNGEVLWIHNQHIQRVSVAPNGIHTMAIDIFVSDIKQGEKMVEHLKSILTVGPTMLAAPLETINTHKISDELWQITIVGQTTPAREWLIEKFAVDILKQYDEKYKKKKLLVYEPVARFADPNAERRFKRAVRLNIAKIMNEDATADPNALQKGRELIKKIRAHEAKKQSEPQRNKSE